MMDGWLFTFILALTAVGYFFAGIAWERERGYFRKKYFKLLSGSEVCCGEWETCRQPCTPRGEKIAERRAAK